jgi:FkbM family methyltransferase
MINWSAIDHRSLGGRLLRLPARALPRRTVMRIRPGPAKGLKWIVGSAIHGCWLGTYQQDKQRALERFVRPEMTVYDIGAQAGFYTLFFSPLVGAAGRLYAFEPCPYEARFLVDHARINRLTNVQIIQAAVSEHAGFVGMTVDRGMTQNEVCNSSDSLLIVPSITLDGSGFAPPEVIKMDVEGAESAVLNGARQMLRKARPVVFVALHGFEQRTACTTMLTEFDYRVYSLGGESVDDRSPIDEIYALPVDTRRSR